MPFTTPLALLGLLFVPETKDRDIYTIETGRAPTPTPVMRPAE